MAGNLQAAEWIFNPYIGISETYTDNAFGTATNEKDDAITTLNAGFEVEGIGRRVQLRAAYDVGYNIYARFSELNGFDHNLLASGNAELVEDNLFLETDVALRSEERRVGKEGRSRWSPEHEKKKGGRDVDPHGGTHAH